MRDMRDQPAGWYRDPVRPNRHRYWTGEHWEETVGEELLMLARTADRGASRPTSGVGEQPALAVAG